MSFCPCCRKDIEETPKPVPTLFQTEVCAECHKAETAVRVLWHEEKISSDEFLVFEQFLQDRIARGNLLKLYLENDTVKKAVDQLKLFDE